MRVSILVTKMLLAAVLLVCLAPAASAALTLKLNPADLMKQGPGPLTADVGVLIHWDGMGTNLISGLNFDVTVPANVTLPDATPSNPLNFDLANVLNRSVAFASFSGNVAPLGNGDTLLTTLRFNVNAAAGDFPIGLTLVSAQQGNVLIPGNVVDISNQVTATGGTLSVAAVPEPSSVALLGLVTLGGCGCRRRR